MGFKRSFLSPLGATVRRMCQFLAHRNADPYVRRYHWAGGNYRWIFPYLARDGVDAANPGELILEVGSRDCLDAIELFRQFQPERVHAFEPSRPGLARCLDILAEHPDVSGHITLNGFATSDESGLADFYEFTLKETSNGRVNIGASSLHPWTSRNHALTDPARGIEERQRVQKVYQVPVFRLDDLPFLAGKPVLLMVVDVEGAELSVLRGAQGLLGRTRYLCLEAGYRNARLGDIPDAPAIIAFLEAAGWQLIACSQTGNATLPADSGHLLQFDLLFSNPACPAPPL